MAWTAPKTWTGGERLYASDLNTYVSDNLADLDPRTVKTFADASARTSGITSPTEGMLSYLADTDAVQVYDGSAWTSVGASPAILQVVSTTVTSALTLSAGTYAAITGLTATITPSSASSKILVLASIYFQTTASRGGRTSFQVTGGSASAYVGDAGGAGTRQVAAGWVMDDGGNAWVYYGLEGVSLNYLDSPATTSSITYGVQVIGASTIYINRSGTDGDRSASTITVMEVAG